MDTTGYALRNGNPAWEFDHIVTHVLTNLPQVDVFRFRRVCRRFDRLLSTRLESVVLNFYGLKLQLRERGLAPLDFGVVGAQILTVYGRGMINLEIKFANSNCTYDNESVRSKIATQCPNLVGLCLKSFTGDCNRHIPWFSAKDLPQMPKLKTLDALLTLELRGSGMMETVIVERIQQLGKLSTMNLIDGGLLEMVGSSPVLESVGGIWFDTEDPPSFGNFPRLKEWIVYCHPDSRFPFEFLPQNLRKLNLVLFGMIFSSEDLDLFKLLVHITDFRVHQSSGSSLIPNFDFLGSFSQLSTLWVSRVENFTANDFMLISESAPLTRIRLDLCPANCAQAYSAMVERNYRLATLELLAMPDNGDRDAVVELVEFNKYSLDRLGLGGLIVDDGFLERLPPEFLAKPAMLYLSSTPDLTAAGVRRLLRRRKELMIGILREVGNRMSTVCSEDDGCGRVLIIVLAKKIFTELCGDSQELMVESMTTVESLTGSL